MRREFLKGYIFSLIADGQLKPTDSPANMLKKAWICAKEDFPAVAREIASIAIQQGAAHAGGLLGNKMQQIAADLTKKGFGAIWKDLQKTYSNGMEVNARRAREGGR
jgi:hypothetical protein